MTKLWRVTLCVLLVLAGYLSFSSAAFAAQTPPHVPASKPKETSTPHSRATPHSKAAPQSKPTTGCVYVLVGTACPEEGRSNVTVDVTGQGSTTTDAGTLGKPGTPCRKHCSTSVVTNCTTAHDTASDGGIWQEADNCIPSHTLNCTPPDQAYSVATTLDGVQQSNAVMCRPPTGPTPAQQIQTVAQHARDSLTVTDSAAIVQPANASPLPVTLPAFFQASPAQQTGATATVGPVTATIALHDPTYIWDYGFVELALDQRAAQRPHRRDALAHRRERFRIDDEVEVALTDARVGITEPGMVIGQWTQAFRRHRPLVGVHGDFPALARDDLAADADVIAEVDRAPQQQRRVGAVRSQSTIACRCSPSCRTTKTRLPKSRTARTRPATATRSPVAMLGARSTWAARTAERSAVRGTLTG